MVGGRQQVQVAGLQSFRSGGHRTSRGARLLPAVTVHHLLPEIELTSCQMDPMSRPSGWKVCPVEASAVLSVMAIVEHCHLLSCCTGGDEDLARHNSCLVLVPILMITNKELRLLYVKAMFQIYLKYQIA